MGVPLEGRNSKVEILPLNVHRQLKINQIYLLITVSTVFSERKLPMNSELQKNKMKKNDGKTKSQYRGNDPTS